MGEGLGCASSYRVAITRRGGTGMVAALSNLTALTWERRLDEVSTATVTQARSGISTECCGQLGTIDPWAHELAVYRDEDLVWQGPLHRYLERPRSGLITLEARDVLAWLDRAEVSASYDYTEDRSTDAVTIAERLIRAGFAGNDPNVLAYLTIDRTGTKVPTVEVKETAWTGTYGEALKGLADTVIDYTTVGRRILLGADLHPANRRVIYLSDRHFADELEIVIDGAWTVTRGIAANADGGAVSIVGGTDAYYGRLDRRTTVEDATTTATTAPVAARNRAIGYPAPIMLRVPDGATLLPDTPASIHDLVCGTRIDVALSDACRQIPRHAMRLVSVTGTWEQGSGEKIQIGLAPWDADAYTAGQT